MSDLEPGYYEIVTCISDNTEVKMTDRTSFAIVEDTEFTDNKDTSMFGINTHISAGYFRNTTDLIADEVYKLGVKNVRDHYAWSRLSTEEDVITFTDTDKAFITELKKYDIGALMASGFNNSVYMEDGVKVPLTEKAINGFANYAEAVVDTFAENNYPLPHLEIWNEYWSWDKSSSSAQNYAGLFDAVYDKVHSEYPSLNLTVGFNNEADEFNYWNDTVINSGNVKDRIGLATVHAYGGVNLWESSETRPEVIGKIEGSLKDLYSVLGDNGLSKIDIKLTETGYSSLPIDVNGDAIHCETNGSLSSKYCVTEKEAGMYLPRCVLLGLANGAESVYPYQLTDGSYNISNHESFFGLLRGDGTVCGLYSPKPQYVSYAALIRALDGTKFTSLEIDGDCYTYSFIGNNKTVTAVYSIGDEMTYEYFTNKPVKVTDIMGKTKTVNPTDGKIELILTGNVQYITE